MNTPSPSPTNVAATQNQLSLFIVPAILLLVAVGLAVMMMILKRSTANKQTQRDYIANLYAQASNTTPYEGGVSGPTLPTPMRQSNESALPRYFESPPAYKEEDETRPLGGR